MSDVHVCIAGERIVYKNVVETIQVNTNLFKFIGKKEKKDNETLAYLLGVVVLSPGDYFICTESTDEKT